MTSETAEVEARRFRAVIELEVGIPLEQGPLPRAVLDVVEASATLLSLCELHGVEHTLRFGAVDERGDEG